MQVTFQAPPLGVRVLDDPPARGGQVSPRGLADRIEVAGGTLSVGSPPGGPTRIGAEIPIPC
jgi:signal transduction histidine kinase